MSIRTTCGALILGGLLAVTASSMPSLAQTKDKAAAALKDSGTAASKGATANARATPTKHRYWRHRGGQHPHYGSRRVRSQVHAPQ